MRKIIYWLCSSKQGRKIQLIILLASFEFAGEKSATKFKSQYKIILRERIIYAHSNRERRARGSSRACVDFFNNI